MTVPPAADIAIILLGTLTISAGLIWLERRLLAVWQDRYGPNRVGPFGTLQVLADMIKIFTKEDWIPPFADKVIFVLAPAVVMTAVLLSFAVVPIAPGMSVVELNIGLLFFLAMSSLSVYSVVLAGWASNNKYALLGSLRAAAQILSYEVFMGLSLMGVVTLAGSVNLREIVEARRGMWFCIPQFLGLLRFTVPLFPTAAHAFAPVAMALGVIGILYGAILAFAQTDLKRLVAYTSISHLGFVLVGVFAWNMLALQGAIMQIICHGLSTGALFMLVGTLQERIHTRDMQRMGGLWSAVPRMSAMGLFFAIASLGLPGLGNFVGEFLVLLGSYQVNFLLTVVATGGG